MTGKVSCLFALSLAVSLNACVGQDTPRPSADDQRLVAENIFNEAPEIAGRVDARLADKATYLGLDFDPSPVRPGGRLRLVHYWQVHKPLSGWKVFVHLNDPEKKRFVNADHAPVQGKHPVAEWQVGTIVRDEHSLQLPSDWPASKLHIYTGLWRGSERLKVEGPQDGHDRILAAVIPVLAGGPTPRPARLRALRTEQAPVLDGRADDPIWSKAPVSAAFVESMSGKPSPLETRVRAAWDDENLYFLFDMRDPDIWSSLKNRDDKLWTEEAVEVFIDANRNGRDYIELQVNPNGAIFDSYLPAYRKNENDWNSGLKAAVSVDGTLNERDDVDRGWRVEMALPLKDLVGRGKADGVRLPARAGDRFRVNFFRMEQPKGQAQQASAWSPPLRGDFHALDRFGELVLIDGAKMDTHGPKTPR